MIRPKRIHYVLGGTAIGLQTLTNLEFDPHKSFSGCKICGAIFQGEADRDPQMVYDRQPADFAWNIHNVYLFALGQRKEWSRKHSKLHSWSEHRNLAKSNNWATPEAAQRLAAYGIFSIDDAVIDGEVASALSSAPSVPFNDAEDKVV